MNKLYASIFLWLLMQIILTACNTEQQSKTETNPSENKPATNMTNAQNFKEGNDYVLFERVRMLDKTAFAEPAEAYSLLLPKGWQQESNIIWNMPNTDCAGTFKDLRARSVDGKYSFRLFPDIVYNWNTDPQLMQFYMNSGSSSPYCGFRQPLNAEQYLRMVFASGELNNPQIIKVEPNATVVEEMQSSNEKTRMELMQYGSAQIQFDQSAIHATVRWKNGTEGIVVLGVSIIENTVPNVYNGTYNRIYTTMVTKRIVYTYPETEKQQALNQFSVIMSSFRTNPAWSETVNKFWKDVRQQKQIAHIGKLRMMDAQTKAMGEAAIRSGQERLKAMDANIRSWEQQQSSDDRMHTNFIKAIREVEHYQDETGKVELASGYDHAWSRGDGSYIMSNDPTFDPGSVFQEPHWKEMKKVD
jgi:hypothetical protein